MSTPSHPAPITHPASPSDLFWAFTWLALQGFGGVMAVVQRELVDRRRWLTPQQFMQDWAVAQVMPGANVVNLSLMIGERYFGWRGALAAVAGMLLLPMLLALLASSLYLRWADHPAVSGALHGMGAVAAGLVLGSGLKLAVALYAHPLPAWLCAVLAATGFALVVWLHWPLIWVLPLIGGLGCLMTWKKIAS